MRRVKRSLAGLLLAVGLVELVGCIWIPGSYKRMDDKPRPETLMGPLGSDKPLWVGRATRKDVYAVLGLPSIETNTHRKAIYHYSVDTGGIFFICGFGLPTSGERYLRLDFDEREVLRAFKVFKDERSARELAL